MNTDPPDNVWVEPRSNNPIAAGLGSYPSAEEIQGGRKRRGHQQTMDVARHPEQAQPTHSKLRAKERPLANDFVSDDQFNRPLHAWFGQRAGCCARPLRFTAWLWCHTSSRYAGTL